MKLQELYADDRAVSPVVGVALLIAMTVILAAVIGAVVLGIGVGPADAPQATLSFSESGTDDLVLKHEGGDALDASEVTIIVDGTPEPLSSDMSAGSTESIGNYTQGDEVTVVWEDPESGSTTTLASYEG